MHVFQLVLVLLFALAGYQEARRFGRQTGRAPWGWDPWVWAIVLGFSFVIGVILIAVAERHGRAAARRSAHTATAGSAPAPTYPSNSRNTILPKL